MASFTEQFKAAQAKITAHAARVAERVVVAVGESVVDKSPYGEPSLWQAKPPPGYIPGQFKGSWHHSTGAPSDDTTATIDRSGESSMAEIHAGAKQTPFAAHFITNNISYSWEMERGGAIRAMQVQPVAHAMVGLTAQEFPGIVKGVLARIGT